MASDEARDARVRIPRDAQADYTEDMAQTRRRFLKEQAGADLTNVATYSLSPQSLPGNVENFIGVAQVPIGLAGPLRINGEAAAGDFYIPMATTEGTLVASYSRGSRVISESGGVKTTVVKEAMQRAPVFLFEDARQARDFSDWLSQNFDLVKAAAETSTSVGKLIEIQQFPAGPNLYTRFNFTTGDAAGQNMTGKATYVACEALKDLYPKTVRYLLSGSMDTDKKHSYANSLLTRGRRVIAEVILSADVLQNRLGVRPEQLIKARQVHLLGSIMSGVAYQGAHAANGLAALFIATGQDAANVAESHAGYSYAQITDAGDFYWSVTLPALIVGTYGGGTGLATQRECLELLGCYGAGKARKFAEICAATVLAGDVSLAGAVLAGDWVTSHDQLGRNRP
ncbi:MAG: hydroxymethylglutaryl-CoA reductase [Actinomycetia bacterium]|nr:hydroxymethylglutaryl-CoA reductase [Actinomycetes bacterium]